MREKIALLSSFVNLILTATKIFVGLLSNSSSILAEGIHSGVDVISSLIGFFGIKKSKKPADKEHPYGHHKFEVLAGLFITLILFWSGIGIIYEACTNLFNPQKVIIGYLSLGVMIFSAIVNEIMSRIKIYYGKKENSISLLSDGYHSKVDVYSSLAILLGLVVTKYWIYADSIMAIFVGLYILKQSFSLGKEATDSLLDVSAGEDVERKIMSIVKEHNIKLSDLKTQKRGTAITANLEVELPSKIKVEEATKILDILKRDLIEKIENLEYVTIQIKSRDISSTFYKPFLGRGFGWQRRGRFKGKIENAKGLGPQGYCMCPKCGTKIPHQRGIPCSTLKCPECGTKMVRR